jgi:hypothetical protein
MVVCYALCYVSWISLYVMSWTYAVLVGLSLTLFVVTGLILAMVRTGFRSKYNVRSNPIADIVASTFFWPQVLSQMQTFSDGDGSAMKLKLRNSDKGGRLDGKEVCERDDEDSESESSMEV